MINKSSEVSVLLANAVAQKCEDSVYNMLIETKNLPYMPSAGKLQKMSK